jgi:transcriptional regulator with XRE-family HTH domain
MLTSEQISDLRAIEASPNRVKRAMALAGVTQEQVASAIGTSQSHVAEICNGNYSRLPLETARRFAQHFGCLIEDLFPAVAA